MVLNRLWAVGLIRRAWEPAGERRSRACCTASRQRSRRPTCLWLLVGCLLGTLVGILPGLGPPATISILLPLATGFAPATGLIMMAGIYYGAKYGGSTTSILLNIPGESSSVVTCIDGYEMAKKGRAGQALGIAAIGSFVAGTLGVIGLTFLAPVAADVAVNFGPPEYSALMVFALLLVIMLAGDSMLKGFIAMFIGLFLSTIGTDLFSGEQRFTGGQIELAGGIEFIALSVGIFAIGEVLVNIEDKTEHKLFKVPSKFRELLPSKAGHQEVDTGDAAGRHRGLPDRHPARRRIHGRLVRLLHHRQEDVEDARGVRPWLDRGRRGARRRRTTPRPVARWCRC